MDVEKNVNKLQEKVSKAKKLDQLKQAHSQLTALNEVKIYFFFQMFDTKLYS